MNVYPRISKCSFKYLLVVSISLLQCAAQNSVSHQPAMSGTTAPGAILIDIIGPSHYWQYELQLQAGSVRLLKEQALHNNSSDGIPKIFQQPVGAIEGCDKAPQATSPDGNYIAECRLTKRLPPWDGFSVTKVGSANFSPWKPDGRRRIDGFAWAPNSRWVAVLNHSERLRWDPVGVFWGLSGHPIPRNTIFLDVVDVQTGNVAEYLMRKNVMYGVSRILQWSEIEDRSRTNL